MDWTNQENAKFVLLFIKHGYTTLVRQTRQERGRHARIPPKSTIQNWLKKFENSGLLEQQYAENRARYFFFFIINFLVR